MENSGSHHHHCEEPFYTKPSLDVGLTYKEFQNILNSDCSRTTFCGPCVCVGCECFDGIHALHAGLARLELAAG